METETASLVDEEAGGSTGATSEADKRGKHRVLAELQRAEQEIKFLEDELEELEKTSSVSTVCEELLHHVEIPPDPLFSPTNGPVNPLWDRWFEGPLDGQGCQCSIL